MLINLPRQSACLAHPYAGPVGSSIDGLKINAMWRRIGASPADGFIGRGTLQNQRRASIPKVFVASNPLGASQ
jgi:hypothetical protein